MRGCAERVGSALEFGGRGFGGQGLAAKTPTEPDVQRKPAPERCSDRKKRVTVPNPSAVLRPAVVHLRRVEDPNPRPGRSSLQSAPKRQQAGVSLQLQVQVLGRPVLASLDRQVLVRLAVRVLASSTGQVLAQHWEPWLRHAARPVPKQQRRVPASWVLAVPGRAHWRGLPPVRREPVRLPEGQRVPSPRQSRPTKQGSGQGQARPALARPAPGQLALGLEPVPPTVMSTVMWCQVTPEDPG